MSKNFEKVKDVAIFRVGDYGEKGVYTIQDLSSIAEDYNSNKHDAPVTVDHKQDGPKYGSVEKGSARIKGDTLYADLSLHPDFKSLVEDGLYDKRSIELYKDRTADGKDKDGHYSLRAVTFLGAQPPEVKGLPDIQLSENEASIHIDFSDKKYRTNIDETTLKGLVEKIIRKHSFMDGTKKDDEKKADMMDKSEVEKMMAEKDEAIAKLESELAEMKSKMSEYEDGDGGEDKKPEMTEAEKALRSELDEIKSALETEQRNRFAERLDSISTKARNRGVSPETIKAVQSLAFSCIDGKDVVTFGEGKDAESISFSDAALKILDTIPGVKSLTKRTTNSLEFSDKLADGRGEPPSKTRYEKAKKIAEEEKISFADALRRVTTIDFE